MAFELLVFSLFTVGVMVGLYFFHSVGNFVQFQNMIGPERKLIQYLCRSHVWFLTFGDGSPGYRTRAYEAGILARKCHWFSKTKICNDDSLDEKFKKENQILLQEKRGHGYWVWKPYIILQTLHEMDDDDILFYIDAGSTLHCPVETQQFEQLKEKLKESELGILGFQYSGAYHPEKKWNTLDLKEFIGGISDKDWTSGQFHAGHILIHKKESSVNFMKQWLDIATQGNGRFIKDINKVTPKPATDASFKEHRHDQSIYSLLMKKHGGVAINKDDNTVVLSTRIRESSSLSKFFQKYTKNYSD